MNKVIHCLGFAVLAWSALSATGFAQAPGALPFSDASPAPTTSPYLNLTDRNGFNDFGNFTPLYQNIVRPQLQAREAQLNQQSQINGLQRQINTGRQSAGPSTESARIRGTGHATQYLNLSHYYQSSRAFQTK